MRGSSPLAALRRAWSRSLEAAIGRALPHLMRRALRRGLGGVWSLEEAPLPAAGAVVVANHHSWWDAYLAWALADRQRRPSGALMDDAQLARFPFFRHVGAVPASAPRRGARLAAAGTWLVVFPEGRLRPSGALGPTRDGAAAVARWSGVPALPVAFRVVLRGGERPEAYLRFGAPLAPGVAPERLREELEALLARLDADLAAAPDPEAPVPGYRAWWRGRGSAHERAAGWRRWWGSA